MVLSGRSDPPNYEMVANENFAAADNSLQSRLLSLFSYNAFAIIAFNGNT